MTFSEFCGFASGIILAFASVLYVMDIVKGKVVPSVATFILFFVVNVSQLITLVSEGVWHVAPFTFVAAITSLVVIVLAFRKKRIYFELPDKIGLVLASIGVVVWLLTKNAELNLYILTVVSLIIFAPLIIKSFKRPDLETSFPWQLNLIASLLLVLGINSTAIVVWIVPIRQFLCSLLLNIGLLRGRILLNKAQNDSR